MIFIIIAGVVVGGLLYVTMRKGTPDIASALRELLLARAEGKLTAEEFELRQSALHAALLLPESAKFSWSNLLLPMLISVAAIGLYVWLGNPQAISPMHSPPGSVAPMSDDGQPPAHADADMKEMVKRLAEKLAKAPKNGEGWALLGHSYAQLHMDAEAADAFSKAASILPPNAGLLADWADVYVVSHERKWDKKSRDLIKRALAVDPGHLKALALAGSDAFERADYKAAIDYWTRMKASAPAGSEDQQLADANISEATAMMTGKPVAPVSADEMAPSGQPFIAGTVSLAKGLKGRVAPSDTVFVVAKTPDGNGPPLAVKRYSVSDLPVTFRLDETSAMVPGRNLSIVQEALVLARISKSGYAIPQNGDIQTAPMHIKVGASNVMLELGQ